MRLIKSKRNLFDNVIEPDATEDVVGVSKKLLETLVEDLTGEARKGVEQEAERLTARRRRNQSRPGNRKTTKWTKRFVFA